MVITKSEMKKEKREQMRGGAGTVAITHYVNKEMLKNGRLMANIVIPAGASIGNHEHINETEYYIITKGSGIVLDDGVEKEVQTGDIVVTGNGASHSIRNNGNEDFELIAIILLD